MAEKLHREQVQPLEHRKEDNISEQLQHRRNTMKSKEQEDRDRRQPEELHETCHETNIDSHNIHKNDVINSHNNRSRFYGRNTRSRSDHYGYTPPDDQGKDRTPPPPLPPRQQSMPQQVPSGGSHTNHNSFNMKNNWIIGSCNDNSLYFGNEPPPNKRRDARSQSSRSNSGLFRNGLLPPQLQLMPRQISSGGSRIDNRDSFNVEDNRILGSFNDGSRYFENEPAFTQHSEPDDADSSSHNIEPNDSINAKMAGLSIHSPTFPKTRSDAQKRNTQADRSTGSSKPSNSNAYNNAYFDHHNDVNNPSPTSTSGSNNMHRTNISSFNTEYNTISDSFNDDSIVDLTGRRKTRNKGSLDEKKTTMKRN